MKKSLLFLIFLFIVTTSFSNVNNLIMRTEEYPPYNYTESEEIKGIFPDILEYLLKEVGSDLGKENMKVLPWARAYNLTLQNKNSMLFSITYTEQRKPLFKWVGPIIGARVVLFAKKNRKIKIKDVSELEYYKIGVITEDVGEQLLKDAGIDPLILEHTPKAMSNVMKLKHGRIDMWAYGENVGKWFLKQYSGDVSDYEVVYTLKEGHMYIAFNTNTPDEVINKFQKAVEKLKTEDIHIYNKIINKYLN